MAKTNVELELERYLEIKRAQAQKLQNELSKMPDHKKAAEEEVVQKAVLMPGSTVRRPGQEHE